jgi:hypothetical protein
MWCFLCDRPAKARCLRNICALFHSVPVRSASPNLSRILRFKRLQPSRSVPFVSFAGGFAGARHQYPLFDTPYGPQACVGEDMSMKWEYLRGTPC